MSDHDSYSSTSYDSSSSIPHDSSSTVALASDAHQNDGSSDLGNNQTPEGPTDTAGALGSHDSSSSTADSTGYVHQNDGYSDFDRSSIESIAGNGESAERQLDGTEISGPHDMDFDGLSQLNLVDDKPMSEPSDRAMLEPSDTPFTGLEQVETQPVDLFAVQQIDYTEINYQTYPLCSAAADVAITGFSNAPPGMLGAIGAGGGPLGEAAGLAAEGMREMLRDSPALQNIVKTIVTDVCDVIHSAVDIPSPHSTADRAK
jgi:hypothetical protein